MAKTTVEVHLTPQDLAAQLRADVAAGLSAAPKTLPPKWFYDAVGSELFERITQLPEYFPTRLERELLRRHSDEIAAISGADTLVELGSGSSTKTRLLLTAFEACGQLKTYVPQDVSESALRAAARLLETEFPDLTVRGVVGDFTGTLAALPAEGRRLVAFLGGTIGNFDPAERRDFLVGLSGALTVGEHVLVGVGLVTDPAALVAAYDDAAGVTAQFNRNVLRVVNRELGADFTPDAFDHVALWDSANSWIEMRLRARRDMIVRVDELGMTVRFAAGEELRTEISAKFALADFEAELAAVGLEPARGWCDPGQRFGLVLARKAECSAG
ncbi:L-histidine N(alpha)-methyltransferase [Tomitella biformata]|uniref:L-histidine N(alpha)-methyltransferase n=1 Tax=Tomitella biformata TaxID=630403 RepID=UPI000466CF55|nr:L-histidine N(alpha)-methyltransferase [Tomitella biformata]